MRVDTLQNRMKRVAVAVVAGSIALFGLGASAHASSGAKQKAKQTATTTGQITIGAEEFPPVLNYMTARGSGVWNGYIVGPVLARGYLLMPDFSLQPWLFDKDCTVASQSPFTVDCTIRPDARWSDGVALTANDFKFTFDTIMDEHNDVVSRDGYDKITAFNVISPTEFQMVFSQVFAPFRQLWASTSTTVLPQHVLEGRNFNKVWNRCICDPKTKTPIGSGPMLVKSFRPDRRITLVPNPQYWGAKATARVVFVPLTDSDAETNAFRAGEVDMIYPQNQIGLRKKIESVPGAAYQSSLGPQWEHFDMRADVPGLDDLDVRKAIATALPRQQLVDRLVKDANDEAKVLNNTQFMVNQGTYVPNWSIYPASGDVAAARKILDAAGWAPGSDGVRAKGGVRLAFTIGVTSGNQGRELAEQIIQEQLKQIGVELKIKNSPNMLPDKLFSYQFQTTIFAWAGAPDPFGGNIIWQSTSVPKPCVGAKLKSGNCDFSGQNFVKTNVPQVDADLAASNETTDVAARVALFNDADKALAEQGVTVVPLFQKPTQLGYKKTITGVKDNPTQDGFTWNIEAWRVTV